MIVIAISFLLNFFTLFNGHQWGGDFAQYIIHTQNLLAHKPFHEGIMLNNFLTYPPGFAILLTPFIAFTGLDFFVLTSINVIFFSLSLIIINDLIKKDIIGLLRFGVIAVVAFNSFFFIFKHNVLPDTAFLFFCLLTIWAYQRQWLMVCLFALLISLTLKSTGIALALALGISLIMGRHWKSCLALIITFIISQWINIHFNGIQPGMLNHFTHDPLKFTLSIFHNMSLPLQSLSWALAPTFHSITFWPSYLLEALITIIAPLLYLAGLWYMITHYKKIDLPIIFITYYLLLLIFWSGFDDSPQNFARYTLPLLPLILWKTLPKLPKKISYPFIIFCLMINIVNISLTYRFNDDDLLTQKPNTELFNWIKTNIPNNEHYMIWEPRPIALMTQKTGATLGILANSSPTVWKDFLTLHAINYIILKPAYDHIFIEKLHAEGYTICYQNDWYIILHYKTP